MDNAESLERRVLLLGDTWDATRDGIGAVNRNLALELANFAATRIYTTVLGGMDSVPSDLLPNIELLPSVHGNLKELCSKLESEPQEVFPDLVQRVRHLSFIVGHSPVTAKAALYFRDHHYPNAKVILFYHVIPRDLQYVEESMAKAVPYPVPEDDGMVRLAERADVVYSVGHRCHWYFTAKFRNRARKLIDHRRYVPIAAKECFFVERPKQEFGPKHRLKFLALFDGCELSAWHGFDIAVSTVNKIAGELKRRDQPMPYLKVANIPPFSVKKCQQYIKENMDVRAGVQVLIQSYQSADELYKDLAAYDICLMPTRGDGYGCLGLAALSSGIPTLIAEDSGTASIIACLTSEPQHFTVPVTPMRMSYRQDASVWRDRVLEIMDNMPQAIQRSTNIRFALKRDEPSKETHDNVITYCLGGIQVLHECTAGMIASTHDSEKELYYIRQFNKFLTSVMKQCWRLKHHPLISADDLFELLPGVTLPIIELQQSVTDKIEEKDRRIVGVDEKTGAFYVYCPTPQTLRDLWSDCDKINKQLTQKLFRDKITNEVTLHFGFELVHLRTLIKGPEFLVYKDEVIKSMLD